MKPEKRGGLMDKLIFPSTKRESLYEWIFAALLLGLFAFKFNDLFLPYFWDELGVYSRGAIYMCNNGLGLMPATLPADISRGHPLLFFFMHGLVLRVFGDYVFVAHSFALLISFALLGVIYIKISKYYNQLTAIAGTVLLAVQPIFLSQSALVLPEVTVTLFSILSLTSFYEKKFRQFAIFCTLAVMTKESGTVILPAVIAYSILQWILSGKKPAAFRPLNAFLIFVPALVFTLFLVVQKIQMGWFFFPYHLENVQLDALMFKNNFVQIFNILFWDQGRYWMEKVLFIGLAFAIVKQRLSIKSIGDGLIILLLIFMVGFVSIPSLSFVGERYVFTVTALACVLTGIAITTISRNKIFVSALVIFLSVIALQHAEEPRFHNDADLGYRRSVNTLQSAIDYAGAISKPGDGVSGNFPCYFALSVPEAGYLRGLKLQQFPENPQSGRYYIFMPPSDFDWGDPSKFEIIPIEHFQDGFAEATIYKVKPK
jgi:4-amino-4-deoxy-L-arabinose transferase-like glycosyltransferase